VTFVLLLIKFYGATNTEIVKSLRKVLSIALSFAIYPKPVNAKYAAGMAATAASLVVSYRLQRRKARVLATTALAHTRQRALTRVPCAQSAAAAAAVASAA
jgi:adenosine 3'-phospho 5'-phosphosulfate transporter B3